MAELSAAARGFAARIAEGAYQLQKCAACGVLAWPPREACAACWSDDLRWTIGPSTGTLIAETTLHVSLDKAFMTKAPWRVGTVKLDQGPVITAFLDRTAIEGARVRVVAFHDRAGAGIFVAIGEGGETRVTDENLQALFDDGQSGRRTP